MKKYPKVPLLRFLGVTPHQTEDGRIELHLSIRQEHLRHFALLHGGISCTLLDSAMGAAAMTCAPEGLFVVTAQLNINFTRTAWENETLIARGEVVHPGSQTVVTSGRVETDQGELVASGTGTFMYVSHEDIPGSQHETESAYD